MTLAASSRRPRPPTRDDVQTPRPPDWHAWASFRLELGADVEWSGSGATWGPARWDVDTWVGLYEPGEWRDVTAYVQAFDFDSGRQGPLDPGDVGTSTATLVDHDGTLGLTGRGSPLGSLLRAWVGLAGDEGGRLLVWGKVADSSYTGDLGAATITLRALDPLAVAFEGDVLASLPSAGATARLAYLLDRTLWPSYYRDLESDLSAVLAVPRAGKAIDEARRLAESVAGILWASGPMIHYRARTVAVDPNTPPSLHISTAIGEGAMPTALGWREALADVVNMVRLQNVDQVATETADASSIAHYGPRAYSRTDLVTTAPDLPNIARRVLTLRAWPNPRLEPLQIQVHDDATARAALVNLGDVVEVDYTGAAPVGGVRQVVGAIAHHVTPEEWSVTLRTFDPEAGVYVPELTDAVFSVPPGDVVIGATFVPNLQVTARDQRGYPFNTAFRCFLLVTEGGGFLAGGSDINAGGGVANFGTLALLGADIGPGHILTAVLQWPGDDPLPMFVASAPFTVLPAEVADDA